jgi:membrane protein YdbS with pleckstrin-like domain
MTDATDIAPELVPLERRVLRLWRIRLGLGLAPVVLVVAVVALIGAGPAVGSVVSAVGVAVVVGGGRWWTALVWRSWRFRVAPHALELRHGVLVRRESTIPFHRVQHIDTEAGPLERWLGLTTLVLRTASASSDATVPGIDAGHAEELRSRILALVGTGDAT